MKLTVTTANEYATNVMETWGLDEMPHLLNGFVLDDCAYLDFEQGYSWAVWIDETGNLYGDC